MEKFGHLPQEPMPLEMLLQRICRDLFMVFAGNGYKSVAFQLIVQDLKTDEMSMAGNLRPEGLKVMLENAMNKMEGNDDGNATDRASAH